MFQSKKNKEKKQPKKENGTKSISMELETMKNDLNEKPASKEKILIEEEKRKKRALADKEERKAEKPPGKKLPTQENPPLKFKKPESGLSSRYLPKHGEKIKSDSPFINSPFFQDKNKKSNVSSNTPKLDNFIKKEETKNNQGDKGQPLRGNSLNLNRNKLNQSNKKTGLKSNLEKNMQDGEKDKKNEDGLNWKLLWIAVIVFLLALGSGFYYYFFILKKNESFSIPFIEEQKNAEKETIEISEESQPAITDNSEIIAEEEPAELTEDENLPESLGALPLLTIENDSIKTTISSLNNENTPEIAEGAIYQLEEGAKILSANQMLDKFSIDIQGIGGSLGKGWLFIKENNRQKKDLGLIIQINEFPAMVSDLVKSAEPKLIEKMKSVYINRDLPSLREPLEFSKSTVNENFRYYNFNIGDPSLSLDWGVIQLSENFNALIFTTSLNVSRDLLTKLQVK